MSSLLLSIEQMQLAAMKDKEEKHAKGLMDAQAIKVSFSLFLFTYAYYVVYSPLI